MNKKVILTEQQHTLIINQILKETVDKINYLETKGALDEGFWDAVKAGLSKLGRYKAGGKIFGKGKVDQQYAEKIKGIIDKQGNELIRQLDAKIKETNPNFPNSDNQQQFLTTVLEISAVYDSIVEATKKQPNEDGYMPVDVANGVINDLREYVNKFLDVDITSVYSGVDENEKSEYDLLSEEELDEIDEAFGLTEADPLDAGDVRAQLQAKRGGGADFASTKMDTLRSNKLPMTLAGIGASLGAFSWLVNTEWFKSLFDVITKNPSIEYIKKAVQEKTEILSSIQPNEGMTQIMNRMNGLNLNANSSPQDFINGVKQLGGGNVQNGINALTEEGGIFKDPEAARKALLEIVNNPTGHGNNLGQVFQGEMAGTGKSFGDVLVTQTGGGLKSMIINTLIKSVPKLVIKTGVKTGAGYIAAKGLGALLGPIGIAAVTTGVLVKLFRVKGQKSSRVATLNALYQSMRNIEGGIGLVPTTGDDTVAPDGGTDGGTGGGTGGDTGGGVSPNAKTNLYNNLKSLFQFIVNNKNTMGTKTQYNTGTGGLSAQAPLAEGKYINDKRVIQYLTKSLPFDKVKNFEDLLNRVEIIRNTLKKMGATTGDKALDGFLKQLDSNPIMATNFAQLTTVDPNNAQEVNQLLLFIKETLLAVYSGNYKFGPMVDKMSSLGGGNINKVTEEDMDEAAGYSASQPNKSFTKDASSRTTFKNNLVKFLGTAMNMFQYLHKTQGGQIARKDTTNKYTAPPSRKQAQPAAPAPAPVQKTTSVNRKPSAKKPAQNANPQQGGLFENENPKLVQELNRIKKIMLS
jgi:hypothetical protein